MTARQSPHPRLAEARALHQRWPVIDAHADSVLALLGGRRLVTRATLGHLDFPRMRAGGVAAVVQVAWPHSYRVAEPAAQIERALDALISETAAAADVDLAMTPHAIEASHAAGRPSVILAVEAGEALAGDLNRLTTYYQRGVRLFQPVAHHGDSDQAGSIEWPGDGGLTPFGRAVVAEANRLGLLIDASHLSPRGLAETLQTSAQPVAFSHGACRALVDHPHNLTDTQLRQLAERGGVFGVAVVDAFLGGGSTVETVADHIDHAVRVIGPQHVGLGTDFDGTDRVAAGLNDVAALPHLTAVLLARGYQESELAAILGGNWLRLLTAVAPRGPGG